MTHVTGLEGRRILVHLLGMLGVRFLIYVFNYGHAARSKLTMLLLYVDSPRGERVISAISLALEAHRHHPMTHSVCHREELVYDGNLG